MKLHLIFAIACLMRLQHFSAFAHQPGECHHLKISSKDNAAVLGHLAEVFSHLVQHLRAPLELGCLRKVSPWSRRSEPVTVVEEDIILSQPGRLDPLKSDIHIRHPIFR